MMGSSGTTNDLNNALGILKGLSDPKAAQKSIEAQLEAAKSLDEKRAALDEATKAHERAAKIAADTQKRLDDQRAQVEAQMASVQSRENALKADRDAFAKEQVGAARTLDELKTQFAAARQEHDAKVAAAAARHASREDDIKAREALADKRHAEAAEATARARRAEIDANAMIEGYRVRVEAIKKAAGV